MAELSTRIEIIAGAPLRVYYGGPEADSGAPLVWLHGFEQHPGAAPYLAKLAEGRRVFAPEHPGFGQSGGFAALQDLLDLVLVYRAWLTPIVAAHGPVDLVGHSLGGMFAAEIAAICPDLVRRLVLIDAFGLWQDDLPMPDPFVILPNEFAAAKWADPARASAETNSFEGDPKHYIFYRSQNLGAASKFMWPIPDRGLARRLKYLKAATLILHGAEDGLVPPGYGEAWREAIPGSELQLIPGAGHLPMVEAEAATLAHITKFLS